MLPSEHGVDFMPSAGPQRSFGHSAPPVVVVVVVVVADPENDPVEPFPVFGGGAGAGSGAGAGDA